MNNYITIDVSDRTRLIYYSNGLSDRLILQYKRDDEWVKITKTNLSQWNSVGFIPNELPQIVEALQRLEKLLVLK